jgi:hypothetical protein
MKWVGVHVGNLPARFIRPCGGVSERGALREQFLDTFAGSVGEMSLRDSGYDFVPFAAPGVCR